MTVKEIINLFLVTLKKDLQRSVEDAIRKNAAANGGDFGGNSDLANSILIFYTVKGNGVEFGIRMAPYWKAFNDGRGKNKKAPPSKAIEPWVKKRGLKIEISEKKSKQIKSISNKTERLEKRRLTRDQAVKQIAFVIARSIGKKGTKATHFFDKVVNDGRIDRLKKEVTAASKKELIFSITGNK